MSKRWKIATVSDITKLGDSLARSIRSNLQWSSQLRKSVKLGKATESGGKLTINIEVGVGIGDHGQPLAGMARAYEYGSGLYGERGMTYPIDAKNKPNLIFFWNKTGRIFRGKHVEHPGVHQREYLQKSINSTLPKATQELAEKIRSNIVGDLNVEIREINRAGL